MVRKAPNISKESQMKFSTSLFSQILQIMPRSHFYGWSTTARQNAMPKVSRPGISMSPCFFANWPKPRAYGKSVMAWLSPVASLIILACNLLLRRVHFLMLMPIDPGSFIKIYFSIYEIFAITRVQVKRKSSALRTNCSAWILPLSIFA